MIRSFYCQLDYPHVPYPAPGSPGGTVARSGCGVCCTSMLIEGMLAVDFPVEACASFLIRCGARVHDGTNYYIGAGAAAGRFGLWMRHTEDAEAAAGFLRAHPDGMAVANIRGDRPGYLGVFSDSGHYVLIDGVRGETLRVYDPLYRPGRYDLAHRKGKVRVEGVAAYADLSVLREDCRERPFFLFRRV